MKTRFEALLTIEAALKAVESNGDALMYVKDQTEAVCLKAVESDGDALRYVLSLELFKSLAAKFSIEIDV